MVVHSLPASPFVAILKAIRFFDVDTICPDDCLHDWNANLNFLI